MRTLLLFLSLLCVVIGQDAKLSASEIKPYFPPGVMDKDSASLYSQYLQAFQEEPLYEVGRVVSKAEKISGEEGCIYRLLWIRSFHSPLVFTLEATSGSAFLTVKKLRVEDAPTFVPVKMLRNSRLMLRKEEFRNVDELFQRVGFWKLPTEDWQAGGLDGSTWILEAARGDKYHVVMRSNLFIPPAEMRLDDAKLSPLRLFQEAMLASGCLSLIVLGNEADEPL